MLAIGYLPSLLYRVSFKATALVYAPFVWIAHSTIDNPLKLKDRLERIIKGELEKVRRGYSWLLLTFLAAKIALFLQFVDFPWVVDWLKLPNPQLAEAIIQPGTWSWWQLALGIDALLTFGLFYFADAAIPRIDEEKRVWKEGWVGNTVSSFLVTWNCRHLANANKFDHIRRVNGILGLFVPALVTPLELLGDENVHEDERPD